MVAFLEENDNIESRLIPLQFTIPSEFTDMEINSIKVLSAVCMSFLSLFSTFTFKPFCYSDNVTSMRLPFRTSSIDRLAGPPMFKGAISYGTTLASAKQLMVQLNDLLCDPF